MTATRENTFAALVNIRDELAAFLTKVGPDLQALSTSPEYVGEELTEALRGLFSRELEFVAEGFDADPLGKPSAGDLYGRAA